MSNPPLGPTRPRLGIPKRSSVALPVSGVFPQPLSDLRPAIGSTAPWFFVAGELRAGQVLVRKSGDIALLTSMGLFGINLHASRCESKRNRQTVRDFPRSKTRGESDSNPESDVSSDEAEEASAPKRCRLEEQEEGLSASPGPLVLSSYEAFFLAHSIGMLRVLPPNATSETVPLSISELWTLFCGRCRVFPFHYAVYLYYRAKGWVPKHGLRVGAHFTLYPQGPPFFHAEYSVRVQVLRSDTMTPFQVAGDAPLATVKDLMTLHRVTNKVDKKLVLCYVIVPENLMDTATPSILHALKVKEVIVERFHPQRS